MGGMHRGGWELHVLYPSTNNFAAPAAFGGVEEDPGAPPFHGGSPWHSQLELLWALVPPPGQESPAGWGPCWAHLFQLQEGARSSSRLLCF